MAQIIREIRVDVSQPNTFQAIVAKQLDCNSRFLKITLVDFGVKIEVPNTAKVTINANRPDGKSQSFVGVANNDGTITVPLAQWMLEVAGELKCDVSVINTTDNKRLTSTDFYVNVQEAANKSTDISENPDGEIRVITPVNLIDENSSDDEYPSAKAVYNLDNITASASGSAITIDSAKAPLQNLKLFGKTTQNGTPTPDAPVPLVSVGDSGSFELGVYGKNIFNPNDIYKQNYIISTDGTEKPTDNWIITKAIPISEKGLTLKVYATSEADEKFVRVGIYNANGFVSRPTVTEKTFTQADGTYIRLSYPLVDYNAGKIKFQVEVGTQATPYEPCNKQTLTMPYELRSKDEIDFAKGVKTEKTILKVFSGGEFFQLLTNTTGGGYYFQYSNDQIKANVLNSSLTGAMCNRLIEKTSDVLWQRNEQGFSIASSSPQVRLRIDGITTVAELQAKLKEWYDAGNPLTIITELATPQEIPLTETELNAYRHLMTNQGTTTVLSEAEAEVDYYINKPNAQAIGNIHSQVNEDYFKLQQAIISLGGN